MNRRDLITQLGGAAVRLDHRGARAAAGDAGGRVSQCHIARWMAAHGECNHGASKLRPPKKPVELLAAGHGYRCEIGDCVNVEVERLSKTELPRTFRCICAAKIFAPLRLARLR